MRGEGGGREGGERADLASLLFGLWKRCAVFWLELLSPSLNEEDERSVSRKGEAVSHTGGAREERAASIGRQRFGGEERVVSDESFLAQLEQRTQQVKITLANLEAEKVRIEGLIARLQPLVPHYDALLAAEQSIREANVSLEPATVPAPEGGEQQPEQGWTA